MIEQFSVAMTFFATYGIVRLQSNRPRRKQLLARDKRDLNDAAVLGCYMAIMSATTLLNRDRITTGVIS